MLRVDALQFPSQSEELLNSKILSIIPEIRISPSSGLNIMKSLLEAISKGETIHLVISNIDQAILASSLLNIHS